MTASHFFPTSQLTLIYQSSLPLPLSLSCPEFHLSCFDISFDICVCVCESVFVCVFAGRLSLALREVRVQLVLILFSISLFLSFVRSFLLLAITSVDVVWA
jgi:hypothetical protein